MQVKFKEETLGEWTGKPSLKEARQLKRDLGMLPGEFSEAMQNQDPDAMCWLIALLRARKNGADVSQGIGWEEVDGDYNDLTITLNQDEQIQLAEVVAEMEKSRKESGEALTPLQSANVVAMRRQLSDASKEKPATPKKSTTSSRGKRPASGSTTG